jgi:predicted esterase
MQSHDHGTWGWWSEYGLGDIESALRRGVLTDRDFQGISRPPDLERMNRLLAVTPYRGAVIVTPWVVGRQLDPRENGAMVADFLRVLVKKAREELPVMTSREATGIGGMSSGGLWALYAGSECSDLFGSIVATQPFTEDLLEYLRTQIESRKQPQRIRMITSVEDHQRGPTLALSEALRRDGIDHELFEYEGAHSAAFAAGPGGLDAMLTFDRWLRGEQMDGTRPLPARDGTEALPFIAPPRVRPAVGFIQSADEPHRTRAWSAWRVTISSSSAHRRAWTVGACGALMVAGLAFWRLRRHGKTAEIE